MKKFVVSFVFVLALMFAMSFATFAAQEREPNDSVKTATQISVNTTVSGSLSSGNDVDWYKFTVAQDGYFCIDFNHELFDSAYDYWRIKLYDSTGVNFIDGCDSCFSYTGKSTGETNYFGIKAGTYYIKIYGWYFSGIPYDFSVKFTASNQWETENNNSKDKADVIDVNKTYYGSLSSSNDVDWYSFTVSSRSDIAITFNHEAINSSYRYWLIYLYDNTGVTELYNWGRRGDTETATSDYISVSPGKYYIKVRGDYYSGKQYSLVVHEKHDCTGEFKIIKAPTCTESGKKEKYCTICNKFLDMKTIPANGHTCDNWVIDKEATCSAEGERFCRCSVCGKIISETIPTLPHTVGEWNVVKAPTCHDAGTQTRKCSECSYSETETLPMLTHEFGEWTVVSGNKLIPPIVKEKTCSLCGEVQSVKDWSYIWVTIIAGVVAIGVVIGIISYIRAFKKR